MVRALSLAPLSLAAALALLPVSAAVAEEQKTSADIPVSYTHLTLPTKRIV